MAARNRPRNGIGKDDGSDAHEERTMWNSIVNDLKKLKTLHTRAAEVAKQQVDLEEKIAKSPSVKDIDVLQELYREGVRLADDESKILNEEPSDVIKNLGILTALRSASEAEPLRTTGPSKQRERNSKRQKIDTDGTSDSPTVPSPRNDSSVNKLKGQTVMRSVSVPRQQPDPAIKIEEGMEASKGPALDKAAKLVVGAEVAYHFKKGKEEPQWIQCNITKVVGEGKKKIYEVQDPEPENVNKVPIYKANVSTLIPIPDADEVLPDYPVGRHVLARYPETTTFYRAEVRGLRKGIYRLSFEDDQNQENEVPRRFVLELPGK